MFSQQVRRFVTSAVRRSEHPPHPGMYLPFGLKSRPKMLALFVLFFGSGYGLPFFIVRYQMLK